jgi:two-component system sensor histidine kinase BarA
MTCSTFSKLEAGKLILESIPFLLRSALDETVTLLAHSAHDKGLELTLDIENNVPDNVIGDPLRLQQILTNLVGNAIKFTESGNIDLVVEQRAIGNNKLQIEVQIRDTGIGIPEKDQSTVPGLPSGGCQYLPAPWRYRTGAGHYPEAGARNGR